MEVIVSSENSSAARDFFENIIESSFDGIHAFDLECRYTFWNQGMERISGLSKSQVLGRCAFEVFPFLQETGSDNFFFEALSGQTVFAKDRPFSIPETNRRGFFEGHYYPLLDSSGNTSGGYAIIHDITERKLAEEALRQSESKYRSLLEQAADGIHTYDLNGNFIEVNPKLCEMLGYTREELLRLNVKSLIPAEDIDLAPLRFDELSDGKTVMSERRVRRKDGTLLVVEISGNVLQDGIFQAIVRDIAERKRVEEELRNARGELERRVEERTAELAAANEALKAEALERERGEDERKELLRQLLGAQEEERRRIARELHDQMGQHLTALTWGLKALDISEREATAARERLRRLQELTEELAQQVHTLAWQLRPTALDDLGLQTAIHNYVEQWAKESQLVVELQTSGIDNQRFAPHLETNVYRIVQEALTNVLKHAGAERVSLSLEQRLDQLFVIVEDNGRGFDVEAVITAPVKERRLGLLGMQERVAQVGGMLNLESTPGVGTLVMVRIPLSNGGNGGLHP